MKRGVVRALSCMGNGDTAMQLEGLVDMDTAKARSQPRTLFKEDGVLPMSRVVRDVKEPLRMYSRESMTGSPQCGFLACS